VRGSFTATVAAQDIYLPHNQPVTGLPPAYQVLYHLVDLFEGQRGALSDVVLEGHLLSSMAPALGIKVPRGMEVDTFLRSVDPAVRQALEALLTELEEEHQASIYRPDDANQGWKLAPTGPGYQVIRAWRRGRMQELERIAARPRGWRRWARELASPAAMAPIVAGVVGTAAGVLLGVFLPRLIGG